MDLIEIAQLVTGLATLIVASVLIWQMIIQKKTLDIAHNDADSSMSLSAVENKVNLNTWFAENSTPELLDKLDKGLDFLSPKEKQLLDSYISGHILLLTTEWRLGRMNKNEIYYKHGLRNLLSNKASLELIQLKDLDSRQVAVQTGFIGLFKEVIEEASGGKFFTSVQLQKKNT